MDSEKVTYIWESVVNNIARKVAEEPMEDELDKWMIGESEHGHMPLVKKPQHVKEYSYGEKKRK